MYGQEIAMVKDARFEFRLESNLKEKAMVKAQRQGRKLADVLCEFLREWVKDTPTEEEKPPPE
jgi:hypothetical protein